MKRFFSLVAATALAAGLLIASFSAAAEEAAPVPPAAAGHAESSSTIVEKSALSAGVFAVNAIAMANSVVAGDVNGDGLFNTKDVIITFQYVGGLRTLTAAQLAVADVNGDNVVDIFDSQLLYQYGAGLSDRIDVRPTQPPTTTSSTRYQANGIDVSYSQGKINWEAVKADGIDFAILRCGYGQDEPGQDDDTFAYNVDECERLGIPYGIYFYAYAYNAVRAAGEAAHCLRLIKDCRPTYPVYYDVEDSSIRGLSAGTYASIVTTFCDAIEDAGFRAGVYGSSSWWTDYFTDPCFERYEKWVSDWGSECSYAEDHGMWQYSEEGYVDGISHAVDRNVCYKDYSGTVPSHFEAYPLHPNKVVEFQKAAMADGYKLVYGADGDWGDECVSVAQKAVCENGSSGSLPALVQKLLINRGYLSAGHTVIGLFDESTQAALKAFQADKGLTKSGVTNVATWKKLLGVY